MQTQLIESAFCHSSTFKIYTIVQQKSVGRIRYKILPPLIRQTKVMN